MDKLKSQEFKGAELLEKKKSAKADLEQNRTTWLLLGFILALTALFAGLELTGAQEEEEKAAKKKRAKEEVIVMVEEVKPLVIERKLQPPPPQAKTIVDVIKVVEDEVEIEEQEIASVQDMSDFADVEDLGDYEFVEEEVEEEQIFDVAEEQPEFPGGMKKLMEFLSKNIKYPRISRDNGSQGRAIVRFTVNTDGSIQDAEVVKSSGDIYLDKEAIRLVESMPKWIPGRQSGKPVRVKFTLPVNFRLQ